MYTVYCHINKINGKVYVGLTSQPRVQDRWGKDGKGYQKCSYFWKAIQKYGWNNFEHIILEYGLTKEEANEKEKYYVTLYKANNRNFGYNLREGGLDDYQPCKETLEKAAAATRLRKGTYGRKVKCLTTGDIFQSISEAERWSGSVKVGECCRGQRNYAGSHPQTGELLQWEYAEDSASVTIHCLEKILDRAPRKYTPVMCENTGEIFVSYKEAAKWAGLKDVANIIRCTKGERQTAGKHPVTGERLKWKKIKGEIDI